MPQMGVSVSEGTITKWLKQEGEHIEADESLLEISTDKVDTEVPSPASGTVTQILVQEGETVEVGTKLAVIGGESFTTNLTVVSSGETIAIRRARDRSNTMYINSFSLDPICQAVGFVWYEGGRGVWDYDELSNFKNTCDGLNDLEARRKLAQDFGDWWVQNFISVPLLWLYSDATINPRVVKEYQVNMLHIGPIKIPRIYCAGIQIVST